MSIAVVVIVLGVVAATAITLRLRAAAEETAARQAAGAAVTQGGTLGVGFVLSTFAADWGWGYQQIQGKLGLEARMRGEIATSTYEDVGDPAACEAALQSLCDSGMRLIFAFSEVQEAAYLATAERYPDVTFMVWGGQARAPNIGTMEGNEAPVTYACGALAASSLPARKRYGLVTSFRLPGVRWVTCAFAQGIRSVTPGATVDVRYTGSWYDPDAETAAVQELAEQGVEVVYLLLISPVAAIQAADLADMYVLSHFSDVSSFSPEGWLTGTQFLWHRFFEEITSSVRDGTWKPARYVLTVQEGHFGLAPFGPAVTDTAKNLALEIIADYNTGKFNPLVGPIHDTRGELRVAEGRTLSYRGFAGGSWMVAGVNELEGDGD